MKVKKLMNKKINNYTAYIVLLIALIIIARISISRVNKSHGQKGILGYVLGESDGGKEQTKDGEEKEKNKQKEDKKDIETNEQKEFEPKEKQEPKELPEVKEPTEKDEREVKDIKDEIEKDVEQDKVKEVEIEADLDKSGEGTIKITNPNGSAKEKAIPTSNTPLIQFQNPKSGTVSVNIGKNSMATIVNNGIAVTTTAPVIVDPQAQTIAIRTKSGVTFIKTLPSQALNNLKQADKPSVIESAVLGEQNGQMYYTVKGTQTRKFFGVLPVNADIETKIDANDGSVISIDRPWYLNLFGILYTT